jgi:hypothetical protein
MITENSHSASHNLKPNSKPNSKLSSKPSAKPIRSSKARQLPSDRSGIVGLALLALFLVVFATFAVAGGKNGEASSDAAPSKAAAAPAGPVSVELNATSATPRQLEDSTEKAIVRDYAAAWANMARALDENRSDLLPAYFTGVAQEKLAEEVKQQKQSGLRTRYLDHGHKLEAVFYSPEGSALQVRDTAQLEIQLLDGDKVVSSQNLALKYIALMTVGEGRWKVRVLQAVY